MRVVLQLVSRASVGVAGEIVASIGPGFVALVGVGNGDGPPDAAALAAKVSGLRVFGDADGRFNESLADAYRAVLVVSQFTLFADVRRGRRPSFAAAAPPEVAEPLVNQFADELASAGIPVETGVFGAMMQVELVNDGPVTIILDASGGRIL